MRRCRSLPLLLFGCFLSLPPAMPANADEIDARGSQFIGFHRFGSFEKSRGAHVGEVVLTSPIFQASLPWDELLVSWNAETPSGTFLKIEARAFDSHAHPTRYYVMGLWSSDPAHYPRQSVANQKDDDGDVLTDTLKLQQLASRVQVRLTLGGDPPNLSKLKFIGLCLTDTRLTPPALAPHRAAWGRQLPVLERSQMAYPDGKVLCSPTTVSMLMNFWSTKLNRPALDRDVPEIVSAIYDSQWKGTGNWPFNMAYPGSFPGIRSYVTRMSDISELEDWIASGLPVGLSVCYDRLRGKGPGPNGHLVVLVGFTSDGDPIINDPGTSQHVRKVFPRKNLAYAWSYSHNAAYIMYPENSEIPTDRFGHWDSWTAHNRIKTVSSF